MDKHREDKYAVCPYYKWTTRNCIACEGMPGASSIQNTFPDQQELRVHRDKYCRKNWSACPIAAAKNRRYGYD